jgi:hypothetical protein
MMMMMMMMERRQTDLANCLSDDRCNNVWIPVAHTFLAKNINHDFGAFIKSRAKPSIVS